MLITVRWRNVAAPNTLITYTDAANSGQYELDLSPCNSTASCTAKRGCPITPITQSAVAKHASATLLVVFRRGLVFTVIITSPFKTLVKGRERMFKIIRHKSTVYAFLVLLFKLPPKKMERSHSEAISSVRKVALRFIFSSLFGFKVRLVLFGQEERAVRSVLNSRLVDPLENTFCWKLDLTEEYSLLWTSFIEVLDKRLPFETSNFTRARFNANEGNCSCSFALDSAYVNEVRRLKKGLF